MKAQDAKIRTLSTKKLALYAVAVAAACFLNCLAMQATDYKKIFGEKYGHEQFEVAEPVPVFPNTTNTVSGAQLNLILELINQRILNDYLNAAQKAKGISRSAYQAQKVDDSWMTTQERHQLKKATGNYER